MSVSRKILLVDDEADLRQSIADMLEIQDNFKTAQLGSGAEALQYFKSERADMVLLDVGLLDMDGRDVCRALRKSGVAVPIIMLTGADTDADTILGLESGANDYVTKPFKASILLARIRAHLRQFEQSEDATFQIGPFHFQPANKLMVHQDHGSKVRLTEKETSILKFLYRAGGRPVARETLLGEVWSYNAGVTTHTLETHIYRLRQKIEDEPSQARLLVTEPGGYRLNLAA